MTTRAGRFGPHWQDRESTLTWIKDVIRFNPQWKTRAIRIVVGFSTFLLAMIITVFFAAAVYAAWALLPFSGPRILQDGSVDAAAWLGFAGSILGAVVGGAAVIYVLSRTLANDREVAARRRLQDQRSMFAYELSQLMVDLQDPLSTNTNDIRTVTRQALGISRRINSTDEAAVKPTIPPGEVSAFSVPYPVIEVCLTGLHQSSRPPLSRTTRDWIRLDMAPAIEKLGNAVGQYAGYHRLTPDQDNQYKQALYDAHEALSRVPKNVKHRLAITKD